MVADNQQLDVGYDGVFQTGGMQSPRHSGITSNGVIWLGFRTNNNFNFFYSTDGGTTRVWAGPTMSQTFNGMITSGTMLSFFIDSDDFMHVVYQKYTGAASDGRVWPGAIMYRRGTPNAGRTDYTWSSEVTVVAQDVWQCPDLVVVKMNGYQYVHIVFSYNWTGDNRQILCYARLRWDGSGGSIWDQGVMFIADVGGGGVYPVFPTIDFRHAGDGKTAATIAGALKPDIYIGFTQQNQQRFGYLNWTGTTWTAGTWEARDGTYWVQTGAATPTREMHRWHKMMYDAKSDTVVWVAQGGNAGLAVQIVTIHERKNSTGVWTNWNLGSTTLYSGSCALDTNGDIQVVGTTVWNPPNSLIQWGTISRQGSTRTWDVHESIDSSVTEAQVSMMNYPTGKLQFLYTDGNADPRSIRYVRIMLTNVSTYVAGAWKQVTRMIYTGTAWVAHSPKKL